MIRRSFLAFSAAVTTAIAGFAWPGLPAWAAPTTLILLHTNDTHDHLTPYDTRKLKSLGGIARRATIIKKEQAQNAGKVLVLDAGDTFQGTPIFNFFHGQADYETLDAAGYDATTVGNHDLDDGLANLLEQAKGRRFKLINTNLLDEATGKPIFMPVWMVERSGLKIGVFGVLGEGSAWHAVANKHRNGIKILDETVVARKTVEELKALGADVIVMLSHSGLDEDKKLAAAVQGIHVIVSGHSHTKVDTPLAIKNGAWTTLVAQAYQWGEYVGRMELVVDGGKIVSSNGYLVPVAGDTPEDPEVTRIVSSYYAKMPIDIRKVVGQAPEGLSRDGCRDRDCALGNWAADLLRSRAGGDVAILNSGGLRADIMPGPVTIGDLFMVFPFDNVVVKLDLTGAQLQRLFDQVAAGEVSMLQVSGITFRIEDGVAKDIKIGSAPLDLAKRYRVATIDYLAQGGDRYTVFAENSEKEKGYEIIGTTLRDFMIEATKANATLSPPPEGRIAVSKKPVAGGKR